MGNTFAIPTCTMRKGGEKVRVNKTERALYESRGWKHVGDNEPVGADPIVVKTDEGAEDEGEAVDEEEVEDEGEPAKKSKSRRKKSRS